jgi:hypothetical protein
MREEIVLKPSAPAVFRKGEVVIRFSCFQRRGHVRPDRGCKCAIGRLPSS